MDLFLANAPTITAPGAVSIKCNQAIATSIKQVIFNDVDVGDTPTISITNPAAPNNIFNIDAATGKQIPSLTWQELRNEATFQLG